MALYEIVNPSDPYTIHCPDLEIAFVAASVLGDGSYPLEPVSEGERVPLFLFGGSAEWCKEKLGQPLDAVIEHVVAHRALDLAQCLDSVLIGRPSERLTLDAALAEITDPAARARVLDAHHDRRRTSLNDIGGRARRIAQDLRERSTAPTGSAP